jgi:hypothetical protein
MTIRAKVKWYRRIPKSGYRVPTRHDEIVDGKLVESWWTIGLFWDDDPGDVEPKLLVQDKEKDLLFPGNVLELFEGAKITARLECYETDTRQDTRNNQDE